MNVKLAVGIVSCLYLPSAYAANTAVYDKWGNNGALGEWNLFNSGVGSGVGNGIMEYIYGEGKFLRVSDEWDQVWSQGVGASAGLVAIYAGDNNELRIANPLGTSLSGTIVGGSTHTAGAPVRTGAFTGFTDSTSPFVFVDYDTTANLKWYSKTQLNGWDDHMVTFQVWGYLSIPGNQSSAFVPFSDGPHYVLGFEDRPFAGADRDYQDLVVEVKGVKTPDGGSALALLGLGILGVSGMRRKAAC